MADGSAAGETGEDGRADARGPGQLNLLKLCVGAETVEDLANWQKSRAAERRRQGARPCPIHVTRMWPRREGELLAGGSLYWVIKGLICVRQRLLALDAVTGADGTRRCALILDPELVRTQARPCRPFQGWRYLESGSAPADLCSDGQDGDLPAALEAELAVLGVKARASGPKVAG
ncbi:MAG: DUF1489 family protein [Pikeienuella sp.]